MIRFAFTDIPGALRLWWLLGDAEGVELCLTDPGLEVDLFVTTDVRTLTRIWVGDLALRPTIDDGRIDLHWPRHLRDAFPRWLQLGRFATVERPLAAIAGEQS